MEVRMDKPLAVAIFFLLCFTTQARAGPAWQERPGALSVSENPASDQDESIGSAADYIQTLNRPVTISRIGVSVRDGRTELIDGHEINGVEVIDAAAESPAASAGIRSCRMAARAALAETGGFVAIILKPIIPLLRAIDNSSMFDDCDIIFAVDGERIRNLLDLADRVQSLARGDRVYLTIARRGRRVRICIAASP
jgi:S1-C subfamily serine protease